MTKIKRIMAGCVTVFSIFVSGIGVNAVEVDGNIADNDTTDDIYS